MKRFTILALLLAGVGFMAGRVITGVADGVGTPQTGTSSTSHQVTTGSPAAPLATLPDFSRIADRAVPAVASISARQIVRRQPSPFDSFFGFDEEELFGPSSRVQSSLGSGVVVGADGYILTNNHVVTGEQQRISLRDLNITVSLGDKRDVPAALIGVDPATDLALLKIDAKNLPTIPWGDSSKLRLAEWVLAIGNPYQLNSTVTLGIVSAVSRTNLGISQYEDFVQTDAAINPGNSGGALVNGRGELIGINTVIFTQSGGYQGIGFAVPSNLARHVMDDLLKYGEVQRGTIPGIYVASLTTQIAEDLGAPNTRGALVNQMARNSDAYAAGLRPGDIILEMNGRPIDDASALMRMLADSKIGTTARLLILRESRKLEVTVPITRARSTRTR